MTDFVITSKTNPKIKDLKQLFLSAKERKTSGLFVCEGVRLCRDAMLSGCEIESVFYTKECENKFFDGISDLKNICKNAYAVSSDVMKSVCDTVTPQGIVCTVKMSEKSFEIQKGRKYIALDNIQNPDNLGAVSRTAEALGIDGIVIAGGCDIYNPKALRASMGAIFRLPVKLCDDLGGVIFECNNKNIATYATVPDSKAEDITDMCFSDGALCVIGNEGNGVSEEIIHICRRKITIKMQGRSESLNAAAAASIVMWEMVK